MFGRFVFNAFNFYFELKPYFSWFLRCVFPFLSKYIYILGTILNVYDDNYISNVDFDNDCVDVDYSIDEKNNQDEYYCQNTSDECVFLHR